MLDRSSWHGEQGSLASQHILGHRQGTYPGPQAAYPGPQAEQESRASQPSRPWSHAGRLPLDPADLATHVLWTLEGRADILQAIPQLIVNVEKGGVEGSRLGVVDPSGDRDLRDLAVRSIFALTSLAYNERLRDRICDTPGFLLLIVQRAMSTEEPSLAGAYMSLLYRLTFRLSERSDAQLRPPHRYQLLDFLASRVSSAASSGTPAGTAPELTSCLGVMANVMRGCLATQSHVKAQPGAPELFRALAQLLVGPGTLCIVFALQALASLVLHEPLGATLFAEENLRRIFEIVFTLVKEADQSEQAHLALRVASDLLNNLFLSPRVLELVGRAYGIATVELVGVLETIATLRHSLDPALPLLELVCAMLRPPCLRSELLRACRSERAVRARVLGALLSLAACNHVDVASAASEVLTALCHEGSEDFGRALDTHDRCQAINSLAGLAGISTHLTENSISEIQDTGNGLRLRRGAACRVLRELSQTAAFRDDVHARLHPPSMVRVAKAALHEQDGSLVLMILLLGFECWGAVLEAERRELLLLARSQTFVDMWAEIMASSKDPRALQECLLAASRLLSISMSQDLHTTTGTVTTVLPAWIEAQTLVTSLAANHSSREHALANFKLQLGRLESENMREREQTASAATARQIERQKEAETFEGDRRQHIQELETANSQIAELRRRGDEAVSLAARDAKALVQMRSTIEAADRRLEDAEITHADLLQRALKAENLCRQLTANFQEKEVQLQQANEDRAGLLGEVERRQLAERKLSEATEGRRQLEAEVARFAQEKLSLQHESASLANVRDQLEAELRKASHDTEDRNVEMQRRTALQDTRAEDLGRRLASSSAAVRAAETARDDALRESSWLRCELANFQRLDNNDRKISNSGTRDTELDASLGRPPMSTVEQLLRERTARSHSDALEFASRGCSLPSGATTYNPLD